MYWEGFIFIFQLDKHKKFRIEEVDFYMLGLDPVHARPESLIIENLIVPSPNIRPSYVPVNIYLIFFI